MKSKSKEFFRVLLETFEIDLNSNGERVRNDINCYGFYFSVDAMEEFTGKKWEQIKEEFGKVEQFYDAYGFYVSTGVRHVVEMVEPSFEDQMVRKTATMRHFDITEGVGEWFEGQVTHYHDHMLEEIKDLSVVLEDQGQHVL